MVREEIAVFAFSVFCLYINVCRSFLPREIQTSIPEDFVAQTPNSDLLRSALVLMIL
jgi:hypothetical protein